MKATGKPSAGNRHAGFDEAGAGNVPTGAGLRPGAKATEHPPDPTGGAPALDPTDERRLETEPRQGVRHRHLAKAAGNSYPPSAYRHRASRRLYPVWACGWSSQTRRRRPEESVQTDLRGLRGQCDLRGSATLVRGLSRFSLLRRPNAFDTTARVARSARRAGHLVQQPGCTPRPRRRGLHEGLDQHGVDQRNGPCRCPTTTAGLPHTGFAERLRPSSPTESD